MIETFCIIPNWIMRRRDVSPPAKLIYGRIAQYIGNNGVAFPKLSTLAEEVGMHRRRVMAYLAELESANLVTVERKFGCPSRYRYPTATSTGNVTGTGNVTSTESVTATSTGNDTGAVPEMVLPPVPEMTHIRDNQKVTIKRSPEKNTGELPAIPDSLDGPDFRSAWSDFQEHRKQLRKQLTPLAAKKQLANLASIGADRAIVAINHSIAQGWQSIHEPNGARHHDNHNHKSGRVTGATGQYKNVGITIG